jgi:hypothetical protein
MVLYQHKKQTTSWTFMAEPTIVIGDLNTIARWSDRRRVANPKHGLQSSIISWENTIAMFELPQLPFSLLLSSTICTPIARLSALACFVDIALLYGLRNKSQPTIQHPFELYNLIANFIAHFADAKACHYFPGLLTWDDKEMAFFCIFLYIMFRIILGPFCVPSGWMTEEGKVQGGRGQRVGSTGESVSSWPKCWTALWIAFIGTGMGVLLGVAAFFCAFNLVTVQFPWLLKLLFIGGSAVVEANSQEFFKVYNATK